MDKFQFHARLFSHVEEVDGKVLLTFRKNGMKIYANKSDFINYESFKLSVLNCNRPKPRVHGDFSIHGGRKVDALNKD